MAAPRSEGGPATSTSPVAQTAGGPAHGTIRTLPWAGQGPTPEQRSGPAPGPPLDPDRVPVAAVAFEALGTSCRVVVGGSADDARLAAAAADQVRQLERRWSRFLPDSEICQLNRQPDRLTIVSAATFDLIRRAEQARIATGGRFNPLLLDQLEGAGYRRSWLGDGGPEANSRDATHHRPSGAGPGTSEPIDLLAEVHGVRLPAGTRFDPGGLGKGLAVDRVTEWCLAEGATTVCVDLGGDLRVHGEPWYGPGWRIGVDHPLAPGTELGAFTPLKGAAVATSSTLRRAWPGPGGARLHHLLDPATGRPSASDVVAVTTCSSQAWWAEMAAKAALLAGSAEAPDVLARLGTPGIAVTADGAIIGWNGGPGRYDEARHAEGAPDGGGAGRTAA